MIVIEIFKMGRKSVKDVRECGKIYNFFRKTAKPTQSASDFYKTHLPQLNKNTNSYQQQCPPNPPSNETKFLLKKKIANVKVDLNEEKEKNTTLSNENAKFKNDLQKLRKLYNEVCRNSVKKDLHTKMLEKK